MNYVFNPKNNQINPVTDVTYVDASLRDKIISPELYAMVCAGVIKPEDIAAVFAVNKSPEILLKHHVKIKESPLAIAPTGTASITVPEESVKENATDEEAPSVDRAFDARELRNKKVPELRILAASVGIDVDKADFPPTRRNLVKAIEERAAELGI